MKGLNNLIFILILSFFVFIPAVYGQNNNTPCQSGQIYDTGSQSCVVDNTGGTPQLNNPISAKSPQLLIGQIINIILGVVGSIALIMFIYGGFIWLTSGGSAENVKKGMNIIVWSVLGLAVIFLSYGLVKYLILNIVK
jgi:hypothetical protein